MQGTPRGHLRDTQGTPWHTVAYEPDTVDGFVAVVVVAPAVVAVVTAVVCVAFVVVVAAAVVVAAFLLSLNGILTCSHSQALCD